MADTKPAVLHGYSAVPAKCPECGHRDFDVQMVAWISHGDGKSNGVIGDDYLEYPPDAHANCGWCGHQWKLTEGR